MQQPRAFFGHQNQSLVLVLKGQVRYLTVRSLRTFIDAFAARECEGTMIIDLRELEAIDSTGMGLLARLGRRTIRRGRRSVIVCANQDVMTCLRSAAFNTLFILEEEWPFDEEAEVIEVPLAIEEVQPDIMGRFILEAHQDLAALSDENHSTFAGVIAALSADLERKRGN